MGLFGKGAFLQADLEDWCLESWAWLMRTLDGHTRLRATRLITPSGAWFPASETTGQDRGPYLFELTKRHMGLERWPCRLEAYERPPAHAQVDRFLMVHSPGAPNGTFRIEKGEAVVSYAVDLVASPAGLIATFAHELSHYLLASIREPIPGGHDVHELTTELTVVYNGFGIFGANHAFSFEQHGDAFSQGWKSGRAGYFSERTWAFCLALFSILTDQSVERRWLKPSVADLLDKAERYLRRKPSLLEPLAGAHAQ
jgi:hypothetical protein